MILSDWFEEPSDSMLARLASTIDKEKILSLFIPPNFSEGPKLVESREEGREGGREGGGNPNEIL